MIILDLDNNLLFITFMGFYLIISIYQIKLNKSFYLIKLIEKFFNK